MKRIVTFIFSFICLFYVNDCAIHKDEVCEAHLAFFEKSLDLNEEWALQMFDSWTKIPYGILTGNTVDFGNFDQCVEIRQNLKTSSIEAIQGKHCIVFYGAAANKSFKLNDSDSMDIFSTKKYGEIIREKSLIMRSSVCLPAACSSAKIQSYIQNILSKVGLEIKPNLYEQSYWCSTNDSVPLDVLDYVCTVLICLLVTILIASTIYDIVIIAKEQQPNALLVAFSIYKNGRKLFQIESSQDSTSFLTCLSGLRSLAMMFILLGHSLNSIQARPRLNANTMTIEGEWFQSYVNAFVGAHPIAVDSFLVIGGLLLTRSMLSQIEKGKLNILKLYIHRYLRLTPVLAFLILVLMSIYRHFGSGPQWNNIMDSQFKRDCEKNWWAALLHIQNYYDPSNACLQVSWYLSVDFQLVLISPLIMYPLYKWGWKVLSVLIAYVLGTEIYVFVIARQNDFKVRSILSPELKALSNKLIYYPTHIRCGAWIVGVVVGYMFYKSKNKFIIRNNLVNSILWVISISTVISVLIGQKGLHKVDEPASSFANSFWLSQHRNVWAMSIAWMIYGCQAGTGGIIRWFLELPLWQPLGKISLSFYLVHTIVLTTFAASARATIHFSNQYFLHYFCGMFVISVLLSVILYLTFEEPILLIERYICQKITQRAISRDKTTV